MLKEEIKFYTTRCKMFLPRIRSHRIGEAVDFTAEYAVEKEFTPYKDRLKLQYTPIAPNIPWGRPWDSAWFHGIATLPPQWKNKKLACEILFTGEALVFDEKGVPEWSLTSYSAYDGGYLKDLYFPEPGRVKKGKLELWIEASAYELCGLSNGGGESRGYMPVLMRKMRVGVFNEEAWSLYYDFSVLFDLYECLPDGDYRRLQLLSALNKAIDVYAYDPANAAEARAELAPMLARPAMKSAIEATAIGHAHIDVAWLWPMRESIRKAARTFGSQINNIKNYPGYIFGASQPVLYTFVKEHYPELYARIKEAVKAGRWELQGGMWVEADCNIINGESLVRQFIHGKNFFKDEFGVEVKSLWLPDVFGYAATLPQIIRKAGCDYFLTQKISWNQFNTFPYHSFIWQGIDGSQVLTHFPPENTYNAPCLPRSVSKAQNNCTEADVAPMMMSLFGIGDGGGGPSTQHLECAKRIANLEGCPRYKFGKAGTFFKKLEKLKDKLPVWKGELYLELHRGTLTTQAKTKLNNRRLEQALPALEFISSALPLKNYPAAQLDSIWKNMLKLQFHDVIPGSSIRLVYEDTEKEHAELREQVRQLIEERLPQLGGKDKNAILAVNSLPYAYDGIVSIPATWKNNYVVSPDGFESEMQSTDDGYVALVHLPANSITTICRGEKCQPAKIKKGTYTLENALVKYVFNAMGEICSAYDKQHNKEILPPGKHGNVFTLQEDVPNIFDAWDVEITMDDERKWHSEEATVSNASIGTVLRSLDIKFRIGNSTILQHVMLGAHSMRLDFNTKISWREDNKLLRVAFPVNIFACEASFDIQYGILKRPMNTNTSWEKAKFQVCGQRYVDISESDYGVALLNDCKYGYRTIKGELELTLLRAPSSPDPLADRGEHTCTYSLLPHTGKLQESNVMQEAASLNRTPCLLPGYKATVKVPFHLESDCATLEIVKRAEKQDCHVLRIVETKGVQASCTIHSNIPAKKLIETDLLEWNELKTIPFKNGQATFTIKPFEIKTFMIR